MSEEEIKQLHKFAVDGDYDELESLLDGSVDPDCSDEVNIFGPYPLLQRARSTQLLCKCSRSMPLPTPFCHPLLS